MKLVRCNTCHANIHLDALVQDNSAKVLLAVVAKLPKNLAENMIRYVALFRPEKSDLNNDRAAKLINETLALTENHQALNAAMEQTVLTMHAKRQQGIAKPFKNHSYLKQVLDTIKDQYFHPVNNAGKVEGYRAVIKVQGLQTTPEQDQAAFEALHKRLKGNEK